MRKIYVYLAAMSAVMTLGACDDKSSPNPTPTATEVVAEDTGTPKDDVVKDCPDRANPTTGDKVACR
jgi:FlaG/FlaF family flagellin (archaellin)